MDEFEILIVDDCTVPQAVQVMAANGAKVLGALREPGRVKATKLVDLAVIQGDLAANPAAAWRTVTPFKDRIGYDSAKPFAAAQGQVGAR